MTPGTLSVEISNDRKILLIHALLITDDQTIFEDIENIQKRILRLIN
jgi:multisubunit Na+/H+ antiporter MnhE subunit